MHYTDPIVHVLLLVGLVLIQNPCIREFPPYTFALCLKIAFCRLKDLVKSSEMLKPMLKQEPTLTYEVLYCKAESYSGWVFTLQSLGFFKEPSNKKSKYSENSIKIFLT